ncbi:MAG: insulinase family protein, partial [Desulfuromonadales bacterium]|nr:insulinase family protein [Desulfuromonadales bacterium]
RFMHLVRDDDNTLFGVGFRTPPDDSTGVAHILEHTVLCGSERFPVRDPFFSMLKRSLNSFMNAMTASDWTLYPFSSMNRKDFHNLLDIYLDAAFFPRLLERDFRQEGHRLEFAEMDNPSSALEYKGVVYNEMKGAMSDPSSLLGRRLTRHLYPTTTYRHNSGGEPEDIPTLTWQQLRDFHARYYHPSNAWFFSYGNLDLAELLGIIEDRVLQRFERIDPDSEVPLEQHLPEPVKVSEFYPLDPGEPLEKRTMVQLAWLTVDINDSYERLSLNLLSALLLGTPAAPLYKALLDSGLGANLTPATGYHDDYRNTFFSVGLQGTEPQHCQAIEKLIIETLEQVARTGFAAERIEAAIHRLEFSTREVSGDSYPYSLLLLMRLFGPWLHGGDPLDVLNFSEQLGRLRKEVEQGGFFEGLMRKWLLDNPHRITLVLQPDVNMGARQEAAIRATLDARQQQFTEEDRQSLVAEAKQLKDAQEAPEDLSCLPTLTLADIPAQETPVTVRKVDHSQVATYWFDQPTNGIGYVTLNFSIAGLTAEQLNYLPVFSSLLTQIGAGGRTYLEMAEAMEAVTGGISARTSLLDDPADLDQFDVGFELKGKALIRNAVPLFGLLQDFVLTPDFSDLNHLHKVLGQMQVSMENSVPQSGHTYAARMAAAGLSSAAKRREQWSGLSQIALVRELAAKSIDDLGELAAMLTSIAQSLFSPARLQVAVAVEEQHFSCFEGALATLLEGLSCSAQVAPAARQPFNRQPGRHGLVWSLPVQYVARVFKTVPYSDPDSAPLTVLARLLRAEFLHREIREKGGAYGGMAGHNSGAGLFSLMSYRDPHLERTLQVFDDAIDWVIRGQFDPVSVEEAILAVFSDLDKPLSPAGLAANEFACLRRGITLDMRNGFRRQLLKVDASALIQVAKRYLQDGESAVAVLAGESALKRANENLGDKGLDIRRI